MAETTPQPGPSSSPSASPPASPAASAPASTSAPSSPTAPAATPAAAAPSAPATPAARPGYIPETHWDQQAGKVKDEKACADDINGALAFRAAEASRKLTLPSEPAAYKFETSPNFKAPEGIQYSLDPKHPAIPAVQSWAHKHGVTQEAVSELADTFAAYETGSQQSIKAAYNAEVTSLGAAGSARVDAVTQWMNAQGEHGPGAAKMLQIAPVAATVKFFEYLMQKMQTQGSAPFSPQHREQAPERPSAEAWAKMSFAERMDFARKHQQPAGTQ